MGISFKVSKTGTRFRPKPVQSETSVADEDDVETPKERDRNRKLAADVSEGDENIAGISEVSFTLSLFPDGYSIGKPSENEIRHQTILQDLPKLLHPYDRTSEILFSAIESGRLAEDILDDIPFKYVDGTLVCEVRDYRKCISEHGLNVPSGYVSPIFNKVHLRMSLANVVKDIPLISDNAWTYGDLMEMESRILKALEPQLCLDPTPKLDRLCDNPVSSKLNLSLCGMRRKRWRQMPEIIVTSNNKIHGKKVCIDRVPESSNSRLGDSGPIMQQSGHENLALHNIGQGNMLGLRPKSFVPDASIPTSPLVSHQSKYQMGVGNQRIMQDHGSGPGSLLNAPGASPAGQDMTISYADNINSTASVHSKAENQDAQLSPLSGLNKRARLTPAGTNGSPQQHIGTRMEGFHGSDSHWKNTLLQQQPLARGMQYPNTGMQKYPQQIFEGGLNQEGGTMSFTVGQQGLRYSLKEEPAEIERFDKPELYRNKNEMNMVETEMNYMDSQQSQLQQRLPPQFMRSNFSQTPWNTLGQPIDNNSRKEDQFQKRNLVQSPRVSAGGLPQSPLSSKSGDFSSGAVGPQFGAVASSVHGTSQKEKSAVNSTPVVGAMASFTSSANDSMQRQHQVQVAAKRRSNSLPKTPAMSGVGSPASVGTMNVPLNSSSPPVGTLPLADQVMFERFSKIEMVTVRFQLNCKKNKVDEYPVRKRNTFPAQQLLLHLSGDSNNENFKDETCKMPLSKSLVGGSMNVCKTRVMNFVQTEHRHQGNGFSVVPKIRTRMIMSEKPNDGTVAMHYGEIDDGDYWAAVDYLPTLSSTHIADLLAAQFCLLMIHEGYLVEDNVQPIPIHVNRPSSGQPNAPGIPPNAAVEMQQCSEAVSGQLPSEVAKPSNSGNTLLNSSQNIRNTRMLLSGNTHALQISQGLLPGVSLPPRSQQPDPQLSLQQQHQQNENQQSLMQQQHTRFQRSPLTLAANPLSHLNSVGQNSNMQLGNQMVNKPSPLQLQLLQQHKQLQSQQQQQQPPQMQRKMMMGLGNIGMGNISNNMVGLGALGNVTGMGGARGAGGTGISAPTGPMSGMNNVGQNPMNLSQASNISNTISQHVRSGALTQEQAAIMATKFRMVQNRTNMLGGSQSGISGMSGARQMNPGSTGLSMLGTTLNRANINPMQRTMLGPMGPPKLMSGVNLYMNQQQQQLQQQHQLQQQQLLLQQQQLQQQQETTSPLQVVVSSPQVGSPSTMGIPQQLNQQPQQQQQASPQQMSQRTPMSPQLSSGAIHPMSAGNPEACPASPQLSSQTLGSVGSIADSPMEFQGVKSNSVSNA